MSGEDRIPVDVQRNRQESPAGDGFATTAIGRPLRVVGHNMRYPLLAESYIGDELEALRRNGMDIVLSRGKPANVPTPSRIDVPIFESLDEALDAHKPDLVVMHWAGTAVQMGSTCAARGVPFAVRTHSFDWKIKDSAFLNDWCIGIWHLPHRLRPGPRRFALPTLIVDDHKRPPVLTERTRTVFTASAALPKKAWPTYMKAAARIPGVTLDVAIGMTNQFQWIPDHIREQAKKYDVDCTLELNVPYEEVQSRLTRHGALVYSVLPREKLGQPRSVIEGALAGIPLVVPDDPGPRGVVGDCAHFYRRGNTRSLARALRAALDEPKPAEERAALAERVRRTHASADVFGDWASSLTTAFAEWMKTRPRISA